MQFHSEIKITGVNLVNKTHKYCSRCKECFPLSNFYKDATRPSGYDNNCKTCRTESSQGKRKVLSATAYRNWRIKQCHERLAFWTNELNKAQKDGM